MNRYEETHAALVKCLDNLEKAQDQKNTTMAQVRELAGGVQSLNPVALMGVAPKLAPLLGEFLSHQAQFELTVMESLHQVAAALEKAMDAEEEADGA